MIAACALAGAALLWPAGCKRSSCGRAKQQSVPLTVDGLVGTYQGKFPTGTTELYLRANPQVYRFAILWRDGTVYRSKWLPWDAYDLSKGVEDARLLFEGMSGKLCGHRDDGPWGGEVLKQPVSDQQCDSYRRALSSCPLWVDDAGRLTVLLCIEPDVGLVKVSSEVPGVKPASQPSTSSVSDGS